MALSLKECIAWGLNVEKRYRSTVEVFKYDKNKKFVKSFRANIKETEYYIHEQYPPEIVEQRTNLVQILKKANNVNKDAYIKYNNGKLMENIHRWSIW